MNKQEVVIADIVKKYENPAAELVRVACQFSSTMLLTDETYRVNAKSCWGSRPFGLLRGRQSALRPMARMKRLRCAP